ncbi:MAG TPA: hypothetical protein PKL08_18045 [Thermoanaerobaculaceae bacterium]|nr:hypothetical protein [Thermoanaerobaculaceae bacterium]
MRAFELPGTSSFLRFHDLPGRDPAILFVHGLGCASSCDYPRIAADPALAGRRMLLVDLLDMRFETIAYRRRDRKNDLEGPGG